MSFVSLEKQRRWDTHFLQLCLAHARMSKDPSTQVGAVIVGPDLEIRSTGFNGFPRGIADTAERLANREQKLKLVVHGEMNAVLAAARVGTSVKWCSIYIACAGSDKLWGTPCTRCAVALIQAGITELVTPPLRNVPERWLEDMTAAKELLLEAGVHCREVDRE